MQTLKKSTELMMSLCLRTNVIRLNMFWQFSIFISTKKNLEKNSKGVCYVNYLTIEKLKCLKII